MTTWVAKVPAEGNVPEFKGLGDSPLEAAMRLRESYNKWVASAEGPMKICNCFKTDDILEFMGSGVVLWCGGEFDY
jgi:hypothetical protein